MDAPLLDSPLPMFPLSTVLFPHALLPLHVFEPRYRVMTSECLAGDRRFGVVLIARGSEVGGGETRCDVGTIATIEQSEELPDGRSMLLVRGGSRFRVAGWLADEPYPRGVAVPVLDLPPTNDVSDALGAASAAVRRTRALLSKLRDAPESLAVGPPDADLERRSWWLCQQAPLTAFDRQRLLECAELDERLALLTTLAVDVGNDCERLLAER